MTVVPLEVARSRSRLRRPIAPPAVLAGRVPDGSRAGADDDAEDRIRMRQNLAAMAVIVMIVALGAWLIDGLRHYARVQTCLEAGHRNCVPVEHKYQPSPYQG